MSNFDKKLDKATKHYENKNYKEALKICDKILAKDYNNEKALELEGEILYKLDRIDEAILNWKINSEYNNNPTAKMRLEDIDKSTKEKALSFDNLNAVSSTPEDEIEDIVNPSDVIPQEVNQEIKSNSDETTETTDIPVEVTDEVEEIKDTDVSSEKKDISSISEITNEDFISPDKNSEEKFNINKHIYNSYDEVKNDNDSISDTTSNSTENKVDSSKLENINKSESQQSNKAKTPSSKGKKSAIIAVCAIIVVVAAYAGVKHLGSSNSKSETEQSQTQEQSQEQEILANLKTDLDKAMESKDIGTLYTLLSETPADKVPADAKDSYDKALDMMKKDGVEKYYNDGLNAYKDKKFDVAFDDFSKAYKYCGGTYLEPHVLYFLGSTENALDKKDDAVKHFKEYLDKYPHSDLYTAEILYNLCLYYNDKGDKTEAKKYAQHLEDSYPSSPYYNDTSRKILYN